MVSIISIIMCCTLIRIKIKTDCVADHCNSVYTKITNQIIVKAYIIFCVIRSSYYDIKLMAHINLGEPELCTKNFLCIFNASSHVIICPAQGLILHIMMGNLCIAYVTRKFSPQIAYLVSYNYIYP